MTVKRSPPPEAEACLCRPYPSSQKGGTLICEEVRDLETHGRWLASGRYRPDRCPTCGSAMHVHDRRPRVMLEGPLSTTWTEVARFRCANEECEGKWQVLPAFLARHLWRAWWTVDKVMLQDPPAPSEVPPTTRARWRARLESSARMLVVALATAAARALDALAVALGLEATRRELIAEYARHFAVGRGAHVLAIAEHVHRLARGVRVM